MTSERLRARVRRDFSASEADVAIRRVEALKPTLGENQSRERIQAAVILLANGDLARLEHHAQLAEEDWRDVLVLSGLGDEDWPTRLDAELDHADIADPS